MKCVCPMGGDRTCPDNCLLAAWHSLPDDQKTAARRRPIVEQLAKQKYTPEAIAMQLGVTARTVYRDIETFDSMSNVKGQGKDTRGRKKSTGRPKGGGRKGTAKPRNTTLTEEQRRKLARDVLDHGKTVAEAAADAGVSVQIVKTAVAEEKGRREVKVDRSDLSLTAQEKFDAAVRQYKRKLDGEFETRVQAESRRRLESVSLPHYTQKLEKLERAISNRKGIMDRITYRKILACLHPDRAPAELKNRYEEAFRLFTELEKLVLNEKESPTQFRKMPTTYEELMAMKAKVQADRRAKRASRVSVR